MIRYKGIEIDRKAKTISHAGHTKQFNHGNKSVMFATWCALILGDFNREELFDHLYGEREDGGPMMGANQLDVRMCQWRPLFNHLKLRVYREKRGGYVRWKLIPDLEIADLSDVV